MSNAKGSDKSNKISSTPNKVTATSRSEAKGLSSQNLRQTVQKAVAMPAAAVRAAMANARVGAGAVRVAYDIVNRLLTLVETGIVIDSATLKATKAAIDTVHIGDSITAITLGKAYNDLCTLNEVLIRVVQYHRTYTDTIASFDQSAKTISKAPFTETSGSSDSKIISVGKNFSDTFGLSENITKVVSFIRETSDIVSTSDIKQFYVTKAKSDSTVSSDLFSKLSSKPFGDTYGLSDSDFISFNKAVSELVESADSRSFIFTKRIEDFILASDQFIGEMGILSFSNSELSISSIADQLSKVVSFIRFINDVARASSLTQRAISKPRSDQSRATDAVTRIVSFGRQFDEIQQASDSFSRVASFIRTYSDTARGSDSSSKQFQRPTTNQPVTTNDNSTRSFGSNRSDTNNALDTFTKIVGFVRSFNSGANTVDTADIISTIKQYNRAFFEVPTASDNFSKTTSFIRSFTETQVASDTITKVLTFSRTFNDTQTATDAFSKVVTFIRQPNDTAAAVQTLTKTLAKAHTTDIALGVSSTAKYFTKILADYVRVAESLYFSAIINPEAFPPVDTQSVTDSFAKLVSFVRSFADTARGTDVDTLQYTKAAGDASRYSVWEDFNDLRIFYELAQYYGDLRTEIIKTADAAPKTVGKRIGPFTYFYDATWTDFNELSFGLDIDQELAQEFWRVPYQLDHELIQCRDIFTKTVSYVRSTADTAVGSDSPGKLLQRTVGDIKAKVFFDFADLFYTQETYVNLRGYGASLSVTLVTSFPTTSYNVVVLSGGTGYTNNDNFTVSLPNGQFATFQIQVSSGAIIGVTNFSVTPTAPRTVVLSDFIDFTYSTIDDPESIQNFTITFGNTGPYVAEVGPPSLSRHNVLGQELLFTLRETSSGDRATYTDSSSKFIGKTARRYYAQGFFDDYAGLTFGAGVFDQDLAQFLPKSQPETVSLLDVSSRATLGGIKVNRDTVAISDPNVKVLRKPFALETASAPDVDTFNYALSAGYNSINVWRDYNELDFYHSGPSGVLIYTEGRTELVQVRETVARAFQRQLFFYQYTWRDFNELTFGTAVDEDMLFDWGSVGTTEISRVMDDARLQYGKNPSEILQVPETFSKEISIFGGDSRNGSFFRDFLGILPIGESGALGNPIMDEELLLRFVPGSKTDFYNATDVRTKTFTKAPVRTVAAFWSDFAELTFGTVYDQELVQYQPTTRPETSTAGDLVTKLISFVRTFSDTITITDSALISVNGGPLFTLLYGTNDHTSASVTLGKSVTLAAGDVGSYYTTWNDFPELFFSLELAQYYYRGSDSTVDIGKIVDQRANQFNKQGGRTQSILNYFDDDLFFNRDLLQQFDQSYTTEIIRIGEQFALNYGKLPVENIETPEIFIKNISKGVGDVALNDFTRYNPLYIPFFSNYEENLYAQYPDYKLDTVTTSDAKGAFFTKQAGFDPVNRYIDTYEIIRGTYDVALLTYGAIGSDNSAFARTKFDRYLEHIIFEELEEQLPSKYRLEYLVSSDLFTRVFNANRLPVENLSAVSAPSKQFSPATKVDTVGVPMTNSMQYTKVAGQKIADVWTDYLELHPFNDLIQNYPDYTVEFLRSADSRVLSFTKGRSEILQIPDVRTLSPTKGLVENLNTPETTPKSTAKPLGDNSELRYTDFNEILSFDPRQLLFGEFENYKFDVARGVDSKAIQYNKRAGSYRTSIWNDFEEIRIPFNDLTQYWDDYVTERMVVPVNIMIGLTKGLNESPAAVSAGVVRKFSAVGAYAAPSETYFAEDYSESVTSSTF
jgi:hypothetical protein